MALALVTLNWWHGKYDLSLHYNEMSLWQGFLAFGITNLCAKVAMDWAGVTGAF